MPPEDNKFKVGIDPVFKGNVNSQTEPAKPIPQTGVFNLLNNQQYIPTTTLGDNSSNLQKDITAMTEKRPLNPKSIVRTYKSDIESAIEADHLSSINIAIAENEKMRNQITAEPTLTTENEGGSYSKNKIIIFISIIVLVLGGIGLSTFLIIRSINSSPVTQIQELPALITTEFKDELNTSTIVKNKLASALGSKLNDSQITVNSLYNIYLTAGTNTARRLITAPEFVALLNFKMPDILKRTLLPDFMVGTYSFGQNLPFIILKTSYFENAYAGMLQWESDMERDFQILFHLPGYESNLGLLNDLTPITLKKFTDNVIVNKDVRELHDSNGQVILLYGIIDKETIIITVNDVAFKEIINRLNKEKTLQR